MSLLSLSDDEIVFILSCFDHVNARLLVMTVVQIWPFFEIKSLGKELLFLRQKIMVFG